VITIRASVLAEVGDFLEDRGGLGREGTALLVADAAGLVDRVVIPDQVAGEYPESWVEVTEVGKLQLAAQLRSGEIYTSRIHSHPGDEPHSLTDDANPAITFDGALSIVVPFFGLALRRGLDACLVYRLSNGHWRELRGTARNDAVRVAS
jgi:hypothetical protein